MMKLKSKKTLIFALISFYSLAIFAEVNQPVPGQITESPYDKTENTDSDSVFISNGLKKDYIGNSKANEKSKALNPLEGSESWLNNYQSNDSKVINNGEYLEASNKALAINNFRKADSALVFSYIYDTFDYSDKNNIFESIFQNKDSAHSVQSGYLLMTYSKYLTRGVFDLYWKAGAGISYNSGRGKFKDDGQLSNTTFNLWNLPLELGLGTKINMGRFFGLNFSGSGLVVGTYQSRSDRKDGEEDKQVRQLLYGYSAEAALEVSLSQMMPSFAQYLRSNSEVGDFSLAFTAKTIEASNSLKDEYKISGASFGLGFKFELL